MAALVTTLLSSACSVVGIRSGTEQPKYEVVQPLAENVEVRRYAPRLAAEVVAEGDEEAARSAAFRRLAAFIFGGNTTQQSIAMTAPMAESAKGKSESIAMTAPVATAAAGTGRWTMRFFMPSEYTAETLPRPNDPGIRIVELPATTLAVIRFTGSTSAEAFAAETKALRAVLERGGWQATGEPVALFYDPPWTLSFLRRNEVAIPVTGTKAP